MPKPIAVADQNYHPFTPEAAVRVAKQFGISGHADDLFKLVTRATESYEKFLLMPNLQQKKDALEKLSKAVRAVAVIATRHEKALELPLYDTLLRRLGELLTYQGIERLLDKPVPRKPIPMSMVGGDGYDEQTEFDRSAAASEAGPKLLIALLREMQIATDDALKFARQDTGGRPPKHLLRHSLIYELAKRYHWLFGKPPTSSPTGQFAAFCRVIFEVLQYEEKGLEKAIQNIFERERSLQGA